MFENSDYSENSICHSVCSQQRKYIPMYFTPKVIVELGDSQLYESDLDLLQPPDWLNDSLISFAFEYLRCVLLKNTETICFVLPTTAFIIVHEQDENDLRRTVQGAGMIDKQYVFFPVNNNTSIESTGGTHWSLLVYIKDLHKLFHFDSGGGMNSVCAEDIARKIWG
eukprot:739506_1